MTTNKTASCHCKKVTLSFGEKSQFDFLCHCHDCRKINGGGNLAGSIYSSENFSYDGEVKTYSYPGGSGKPIEFSFCPNCGTPLFAYPTSHEGMVVIRANCFDKDADFEPQKSLFPNEAHSWDKSTL